MAYHCLLAGKNMLQLFAHYSCTCNQQGGNLMTWHAGPLSSHIFNVIEMFIQQIEASRSRRLYASHCVK